MTELTNEKIDRADMMHFMERDDVRKLWDALDQPQTYFRFADKLKPLIHQAEITRVISELKKVETLLDNEGDSEYCFKLQNAIEDKIQALEKEIVS